MTVTTYSRFAIENETLPGPSAVISMADSEDQLAQIKDSGNVVARMSLIFNDAADPFQIVRPPSLDDARRILAFINEHHEVSNLIFQCQVGVGRSHAVKAALQKIGGVDNRKLLEHGTYNRRLYRLLLQAANLDVEPEKLVSINVRVKYPPDRLRLLVLALQRQRYDNWEAIAVTDGPNPAVRRMLETLREPRVRLIETERALGRWGHPHRQRGFEECRGEFIGMANDDNYFVPGYIEQMVNALADADLALCGCTHAAQAWAWSKPGWGVGSWMARASLVRQVPFTGDHVLAHLDYGRRLTELAGDRGVKIMRALFVHN